MSIYDKKAEELEAKGFYRRAASRWAEVISLLTNDSDRKLAAERRKLCINKALLSPVKSDTYRDVSVRIHQACRDMGLINKDRFRNYLK
ncbi:PerC family transcriptional regulator [Escherichia albertii]|uniref:PerC family transcriptional regulator n=1 Tax=Escherichia albertii TaxID=208962 RepID=UPI0007440572|nr:PerC family transcriptional regulator [Escherichia albertii]MCZ8574791.1 PerC family transcriptional regulator [Escherichia albertii]QTA24367.1 PerC family transcriptional regulator [Escherichia albertii]